jgi:hypothetical protein
MQAAEVVELWDLALQTDLVELAEELMVILALLVQ